MLCSEVISIKGDFDLSSNSQYLIAPIASNKVTLKQILPNAQLSTQSIIDVPFEITHVALSPDSEYILIWSSKHNEAAVFDLKENLICKIDEGTGILNCFWAPDSRQILLITPFKLSVYNLTNASTCWFKSPKNMPKSCVFSACGKYMALCERKDCKDYVGLYFVKDWKLLNYFPLPEMMDLAGIAWAPNNSFLVAWDTYLNYRLVPICLLNGPKSKFSPYEYALGVKDVIYSNNSLLVAIGSYDQKVRLLNAMTWRLIGELDCPASVTSNSDNLLCYKEKERERESISSKTSPLLELEPLSGNIKIPSIKVVPSEKDDLRQGIRMMEFSPSDSYIAAKNDNMPTVMWVWSAKTLQLVSVVIFSTHIRSFEWSPNREVISVCTGSSRVFFWSPETMISADLPFANTPIQPTKLKWTKDGKNIAMSDRLNATVVQISENLFNRLICE